MSRVYRKMVKPVAICSPAERTIVVSCDAWLSESGVIENEVTLMPVLGIELSVVDHWWRKTEDQCEYENEERLREAHYEFDRREVVRELLVAPPNEQGDIVSLSYLRKFESDAYRYEVVVCPWPQCNNETELQPIIAKLVAGLRDNFSKQS